MNVLIHGYKLCRTTWACPEQYDVYDGDKMVAYFRLRHGTFTVEVPDAGGKLVYQVEPHGDGIFSDDERLKYLTEGIEAVQKHYLNADQVECWTGESNLVGDNL